MATLAEAALSAREHRVLDGSSSGSTASWATSCAACGCTARGFGGATGWDSDVDLLVVSATGRESDRVSQALHEAAKAEGASPVLFSVQVYGLDWLAECRAIEASS